MPKQPSEVEEVRRSRRSTLGGLVSPAPAPGAGAGGKPQSAAEAKEAAARAKAAAWAEAQSQKKPATKPAKGFRFKRPS